jgi:hypothetical protein
MGTFANSLLISLALTIFGTACTKTTSFRTEHPTVVTVDDLPADFKIPANIWNIIEKTGDSGAEEKSHSSESATTGGAGVVYSTVKLFLTEKNQGILKSPAYEISFPRGGGSVDISEYLSGEQGTFFVGMELPEEFQEGSNFKAIYISQARKRKIDDRVYGAGCSQYFDITPKFLEMMKSEGIKANTTRQRHTTVLAGHYVFSVIKDNRIFITQVTIADSQNKNLLCEAL